MDSRDTDRIWIATGMVLGVSNVSRGRSKAVAASRTKKTSPLLWVALAALFFGGVVLAYVVQFGRLPFSDRQDVWGWFGDYVGGVVGALFGFATVLILVLEREASRRDAIASAASAREQAKLQRGMRASTEVLKIVDLYQSHIDRLLDRPYEIGEASPKSIRSCCADARTASLLGLKWARLINAAELGVFARLFALIESQIDVASDLGPKSRRRIGSFIEAANREFLHMIHRLHVEHHEIPAPEKAQYDKVVLTLERWKHGNVAD